MNKDSDSFFAPLEEKVQFKVPDNILRSGIKICALKTTKAKIAQRPNMDIGLIPKHPASVLFNGRSGSGKTTLCINLLVNPEFYGANPKSRDRSRRKHYFDEIYLFSPTAGSRDDLVVHLLAATPLTKDRIHNEFDSDLMEEIIDKQNRSIDEFNDISKSKKVLILLDDIQADRKFLNSKIIKKIFLMNRHSNISTWLMGQSFTLTPRACRLQANNLFIYRPSGSEEEILCREFRPRGGKEGKELFIKMLRAATKKPYGFLHINMSRPCNKIFSSGLEDIMRLV